MRGAVILAGGKGLRIGLNKAFMILEGKPLISHVVDKALKVADEVIVVIGRNDDEGSMAKYIGPPSSQVKILKDVVEGQSPLIGLFSGMRGLRSDYALAIPCDSPFIKIEVLKHLFIKAVGFDAAIPKWPNGYIEPLHSVYNKSSVIKAAEEALKMGRPSNLDMIKRLSKVNYIPINEIKNYDQKLLTFFNINTMRDLKAAKHIILSKNL